MDKMDRSDKRVYLVNVDSLGVDIPDKMEVELGKLRPLVSQRYGSAFPLYSGDMILWDSGLYSDEVGNKSIRGITGIRCEVVDIWRDIIISKDGNTITGSLYRYIGEFVPVYKLLEQGLLVDITINFNREEKLRSIGI